MSNEVKGVQPATPDNQTKHYRSRVNRKAIVKALSTPIRGGKGDAEAAEREFEAKVSMLFDLHGIQPNDWEGLARTLAVLHYPGFTRSRPAGRKEKWDIVDAAHFVAAVYFVRQQKPELSQMASIRHVAQRVEWMQMTAPGGPLLKDDALRKMFAGLERRLEQEADRSEALGQEFIEQMGIKLPEDGDAL